MQLIFNNKNTFQSLNWCTVQFNSAISKLMHFLIVIMRIECFPRQP